MGVEKCFLKVSEVKSSGFVAVVGVLGLFLVVNLKLWCLLVDGIIVFLVDIKFCYEFLDFGY